MNSDSKASYLYIPMLSALLSFSGAIGGSYIAAIHGESLWEKQEYLEQKKNNLLKKIELLKHVNRIVGLSTKIGLNQQYVENQESIFKIYQACILNEISNCPVPVTPKDIYEMAHNEVEIDADFVETIALIQVTFEGDAVKLSKQLSENRSWWLTGGQDIKKLLSAMQNEIQQDLKITRKGI